MTVAISGIRKRKRRPWKRSARALVAPPLTAVVVVARLIEPQMPPMSGVTRFAAPMEISSCVPLPRRPVRFSTIFALMSTSSELTTAMLRAPSTMPGSACANPGSTVTAMIWPISWPSGIATGICPSVGPSRPSKPATRRT
jgi:hypothetical protein